AAPDPVRLAQNAQPFLSCLIAGVEDKAMRLHDCRWANILAVRPETGTGGSAGGAQDAVGSVGYQVLLFLRLQSFTTIGGRWVVVDKVGHHAAGVFKKRVRLHNQVLN